MGQRYIPAIAALNPHYVPGVGGPGFQLTDALAVLSTLLGSRDSIHGRENYDCRQAFEIDLH